MVRRVIDIPPIIFINCGKYPFDVWIKNLFKLYVTRNRNTLHRFVGQRVLLARTGRGKPVVFAEATISNVIKCETWGEFQDYVRDCMTYATDYDWKDKTKKKYLYKLENLSTCVEWTLPDNAIRHGYVWAEVRA